MKIYFTAPIIYKDSRGTTYSRIINTINKLGHTLLTYDILGSDFREISLHTKNQRVVWYNKVLKWMTQGDIVITEASFPSTIHIGHEVSIALEKNKPVIALYEKGHEPFFLSGLKNDKLLLVEYTSSNLEDELEYAINEAKEVASSVRFNFYIPTKQAEFINKLRKDKNLSRSAILRQIIAEKMDSH